MLSVDFNEEHVPNESFGTLVNTPASRGEVPHSERERTDSENEPTKMSYVSDADSATDCLPYYRT